MASSPVAHALRCGVPLDELALTVAADFRPTCQRLPTLAALDDLAGRLPAGVAHAEPEQQARALCRVLHDEAGFRGNDDDYYDPRNSYLDEVVDRRAGLPIALAIVWIAVATRAGIRAEGVGFPGHFLVRVAGELHDPFSAGVVDDEGLRRLAQRHLGDRAALRPEHLVAVEADSIVARIYMNLKHAHERRGDLRLALLATERLVELTGLPTMRRDRGLLSLRLGATASAAEDLRAYLATQAAVPDRPAVQAVLASIARTGVARWN